MRPPRKRIIIVSIVLLLVVSSGMLFPSLGSNARHFPGRAKDAWQSRGLVEGARRDAATARAELAVAQEENAALRQALRAGVFHDTRTMLARVLGVRPGLTRRQLTIDKGSDEGAEPGMVAFVPHDMVASTTASSTIRLGYVGRIESVSAHTARVVTSFDASSIISAQISEIGVPGVVEGQFGSGLVFRGILPGGRDATARRVGADDQREDAKDFAVGQHVTSTGPDIPSDLLLGTVTHIKRKAGESQFTLLLEAPFEGFPDFVFLFHP